MAEWRSVDDLAAVDAVGVGAVAAAVAAVIAAAVAAVVAAAVAAMVAAAVVDEAVVAVGRELLHPHLLLRHYQSQNRRAVFYANLTRNHPKAEEEEEERRFGRKQIHRA